MQVTSKLYDESMSTLLSSVGSSGAKKLTKEQEAEIRRLKAIDAEVKAHEQAHKSAAGNIAVSGASFSYTTGPDGKRYATGGDVQIDTAAEKTPEKTLQKAQRIRAAALAPASPSAQDLKVAAQASQMEMKARLEIAKNSQPESLGYGKDSQMKYAQEPQLIDTYA